MNIDNIYTYSVKFYSISVLNDWKVARFEPLVLIQIKTIPIGMGRHGSSSRHAIP